MGRPLRVLHVVVNMNRGGAETLLMNLYRNIDRTKVQFDFLTCKPGVFDSEIEDMGGIIHRIPYVTDVGHLGYKKALVNFFESQDYKIVHAHLDKMSGIVLQCAKRSGVPVRIAHSHNTRSEGGIVSKLYKSFAGSHIKKDATHRFACSHSAAEWLFGRQSNQTYVLKNGIDNRKFLYSSKDRRDVRAQLNIRDDTFVIGHVGRFNHQKNHEFLLEVFQQFSKVHGNTILLLAGNGVLKKRMEMKSRELGIHEHVNFLGVREDVDKLLQAFDMFLFPSYHEGLPVTLIEAQNAGLPCFITNTITEEVDMELGLVQQFPLPHHHEWVEAIKALSVQRSSRLIDPAKLTQKGYDIQQTAIKTQNDYIQLGREVS
ncbi:glycosyltransferase family 1 protein [Halobacillus sp. A1]|uniref:glycosyltransferase family 1 protein n=1 Tax=Halobacillus sp. A1 TaxID=2880262 RepID=UPI0020A67438|nr:glycosyltransferase family 1 protein [Halobacillus sp. A1]